MYKNIIFDFGGVIAKFDPVLLTKPYVKDDFTLKIISRTVFDRKYWDKLDIGSITDDDVKSDFQKYLSPEHCKIAEMVFDNWIVNLVPLTETIQLIRDIYNNNAIDLYLLSDISEKFADSYKNVKWIDDVLSLFKGLTFSGKEHMVKPHIETFKNLIQKYNLMPDECIFIDDNPINVEGAEQIGIKGYVFDGNINKLRCYLNNL